MAGSMDKVVIVTGAGSGIGAATAECLAAAGAWVMLTARREDRIADVTARIRAAGGKAEFRAADVSDRAAMLALADATMAAFGRIDVLVNNAGVMTITPLSDLAVDAWDSMIDINLKGALYAIAAVLPVMRRQRRGHIVNVSSTLGHQVNGGASAVYAATKAAILAISDGLRQEVGPEIRSTVISPGAVTSELHDGIADPDLRARIAAAYEQALPAMEVANAILYAISCPAETGINEIVIRPASQTY
jgi:NADP-dependent 3-hydroxy acid dehydrogenase YdfG